MEQEARLDLVRRLFALMTGMLEDVAAQAAEGQGALVSPEQRKMLADEIYTATSSAAVIAEATAALSVELR